MSLCPRAAAQALHSPPELHQHEYKQHAAYFDPQDHPHYTLHPSSRFGADNEPLLESSAPSDDHPNIAGIRSPQSLHSLLACRLARLVSSAVAASSSSSSSSATGSSASSRPSRKRWLPALLLLNLAVTVAAFVAACVHFNTFTTLFLYLALLIVAFPIFSLTFLLLNSNSASYKLRLPQFSPFSSPDFEQPSFRFSSNSQPPTAASTSRRSCRSFRLDRLARYVQYVLASLWFLALVEWLFFQPFFDTTSPSASDDLAIFLKSSPASRIAPPPQPLKVFIASNLYNSQDILPTYSASLKGLVHHLGAHNVFVSIYESHSTDQTKSMLSQLDADLAHLHVDRQIARDDGAARMNKSSPVQDRIEFLANVRNLAMQPLAQSAHAHNFSHVLWINDIVFTPQDAVRLLNTNNAHYDQACAMDFIGNGFYDTWVTRDAQAQTLKRQWPYFKQPHDIDAMRQGTPFVVNSCWNGMSAFDAKWFVPPKSQSAQPAQPPIQFRSSSTCLSSECQLVSYDIHRATHPKRPNILINPAVKVAYTHRHYRLYNSILSWPLVRPWRIVWRDWIAHRLFGWLTESRRWPNECQLKQPWWSTEPASERKTPNV